MTKWEYSDVVLKDTQGFVMQGSHAEFIVYGNQPVKIKGDVHEHIRALGLDGWELVSYALQGGIYNNPAIERWVFKRAMDM
jgi:hypothetical protein